jgi:hypothetical protein
VKLSTHMDHEHTYKSGTDPFHMLTIVIMGIEREFEVISNNLPRSESIHSRFRLTIRRGLDWICGFITNIHSASNYK